VPPTIAVILKGYPRLSETFIAQELLGLEQRGISLRLYALRQPTDPAVHPIHREIAAPVTYLPEYLHHAPLRVLRAWRAMRLRPGYRQAKRTWLGDLLRDRSRNRFRRFGQALVLAHELSGDVTWLYVHFLHTPASVTRYAALIRDLPWSGSAHAKDIWTIPDWEKREKLAHSRWVVTCTQMNARHLVALAPHAERIELLYHGLDLSRFPPPEHHGSARNGHDPEHPVRLLSIGRAVEKKGYRVTLDALTRLPRDLQWRFTHVGGGPLLPRLKQQAEKTGLASRIRWLGPLSQDRVLEEYRDADAFILASRIAEDGDRDGLPNVLMEAQSQAVPCISTLISAIPELIIDNETGILVPADDAKSLARAIETMIRFPDVRVRLGEAGFVRVKSLFSFERSVERLAQRFGEIDQPTPCASPSTRP
jgi:glycosyltransferase involved in cell wall biosynthesis